MNKDIKQEETTEVKGKSRGGNTGLPFGLCAKFGIALPENASPRDAWYALKEKTGLTPDKVYAQLKEKFNGLRKDKSNEIKTTENESKKIDLKSEKEKFVNSERIKYNTVITQKKLDKAISAGNEEMQSLTLKLFNESGIKVDKARPKHGVGYNHTSNTVELTKDWVGGGDTPYNVGQPLYHEFWHAVDNNYGKDTGQWLITGEPYIIPLSSSYELKNETILNRGITTFGGCLTDENRKHNTEEIKAEYQKDLIAYYNKQGIDFAGLKKQFDKIQADTENLSVADNLKYFDEHPESAKLKWQYVSLKKNPVELQRKWGDLSDMIDARTDGADKICGMGHRRGYWDGGFLGGNSGLKEKEAFAEIASAKATNSESYNLIKKYYPMTCMAFDEIYEHLKGGARANGRKVWGEN